MKPETEQYITDMAEKEAAAGRTMTAPDLAAHMQQDGITVWHGGHYRGRGVYTALSAAYNRRVKAGRKDQADKIATVFTMPNGHYAYDQY